MSLRLRLVAAFAYVLVLVLAAIEVPFALSVADRVEAEVRAHAESQAHLVAAAAAGRLGSSRELARIAERAGEDLGGRVIVVDSRGRLLADSAGTGLLGSPYATRPEIASVLASGRTAQGTRRSETLDEELLYTAVPIVGPSGRAGVVRLTQSAEPVRERVRRDVLALVGIGVTALLLGLALAWVLAGSLARPLRALAATARRVEAGDLEARAAAAGSAEQREVATAFNAMTSRLASSLEAQREFVGNASHQLRTPLTGLRLRLEAAGDAVTDADVRRELAAAEAEVARLSRLLTALLTLARAAPGDVKPRPVSLAEAAAAARERWLPRAALTEQTIVLAETPDVTALASEEDVATMLDSMLENALAYGPNPSEITIEWNVHGDTATIAVLDEGPGLEPGELEQVFERFRRGSASARSAGTGLGLAVVRTLAERWGGAAAIANRPEGGARVEVALPRAPETARLEAAEPAGTAAR